MPPIKPEPWQRWLTSVSAQNCHFENIQSNIQKKKMRALAISALDYFTTSTVTFLEGEELIELGYDDGWAQKEQIYRLLED